VALDAIEEGQGEGTLLQAGVAGRREVGRRRPVVDVGET
jgi:microcompartment protein CcmK/EutM